MTTAEILEARGEARGRAEGEVSGRADTLLLQLEVKFGQLPETIEQTVRSAGYEQLGVWCTEVITADSLADLFG
jgi:predicted transposase YdaD